MFGDFPNMVDSSGAAHTMTPARLREIATEPSLLTWQERHDLRAAADEMEALDIRFTEAFLRNGELAVRVGKEHDQVVALESQLAAARRPLPSGTAKETENFPLYPSISGKVLDGLLIGEWIAFSDDQGNAFVLTRAVPPRAPVYSLRVSSPKIFFGAAVEELTR